MSVKQIENESKSKMNLMKNISDVLNILKILIKLIVFQMKK